MTTRFQKKCKKFIDFIKNQEDMKCDFYKKEYNEDYAKIRLVPYDLGIREIPVFRKYCKKIGLNVTNTFHNDMTRTCGYKQYHDCFLTDDGTFLINKALEDIK